MTFVDARVAAVSVRLGGADLSDTEYAALSEVRVEQSVHVPDAVTMRLLDPNFTLFDAGTFDVGKSLSVAFDVGKGPVTVGGAEITAISIGPGTAGRHELVVTALDQGHRLAREVKRRTFPQQTDADIARRIASDYGLSADIDNTGTTYAYLAQAESDYAFLSRRAMLAGFDWWVSSGTLHFKKAADTGSGPTLSWGENLYEFRARFSASEAAQEVEVRGWDSDTQEAIVGVAKPDRSGIDALGATARAASALVNAANTAYPAKRYVGSWAVQDTTEANTVAKALASRAIATEVMARGEASGDPAIRAGARVTIEGVGDRLTGSYLLTSVEHVLVGGRAYVTRFNAGAREASQLADLLGRGSGTATPWDGSQPVIGIVTNIQDEERPGRIKVKFPSLSDEEESEWARVVAPGAGKDRGWQLSPEVSDEVLVVFEHGDPRRPLILGGLWSKGNPPPLPPGETVKNGQGVAGSFRTRSGHRIEILEGESEADQRIVLALSDGETEFVIGADGVTLKSPSDITITTDGAFSLKATEDVNIEGKNILLKGQAKVSIESKDFSAKGTQSATVEGSTAGLKGTGTVKVEGGSMAEIKGGMVKLN